MLNEADRTLAPANSSDGCPRSDAAMALLTARDHERWFTAADPKSASALQAFKPRSKQGTHGAYRPPTRSGDQLVSGADSFDTELATCWGQGANAANGRLLYVSTALRA